MQEHEQETSQALVCFKYHHCYDFEEFDDLQDDYEDDYCRAQTALNSIIIAMQRIKMLKRENVNYQIEL